jgi:hypothetical protein
MKRDDSTPAVTVVTLTPEQLAELVEAAARRAVRAEVAIRRATPRPVKRARPQHHPASSAVPTELDRARARQALKRAGLLPP